MVPKFDHIVVTWSPEEIFFFFGLWYGLRVGSLKNNSQVILICRQIWELQRNMLLGPSLLVINFYGVSLTALKIFYSCVLHLGSTVGRYSISNTL